MKPMLNKPLKDLSVRQLQDVADHYLITFEPFLAVKALYRARRLAKSDTMRHLLNERAQRIINVHDLGNFNTRFTEQELNQEVTFYGA